MKSRQRLWCSLKNSRGADTLAKTKEVEEPSSVAPEAATRAATSWIFRVEKKVRENIVAVIVGSVAAAAAVATSLLTMMKLRNK